MIIGLAGTFGAGKDLLANHLQEKFGIMHISTGDIVREIAQAQKGSVERPVLHQTADELRRSYGGAVLVERALDRYHNSMRTYAGVVVTGLRSTAEAKAIKDQQGIIVYVDAPLVVRFARVQARNRDEEARITLEDFKARESTEMSSGITDADFNIEQIGQMADIKLVNDGTPEEFYLNAEKALKFV